MLRAALSALVALVALSVSPGPAAGAAVTVGSPGTVEGTDVAVAPDGTGHAVWAEVSAGSSTRTVHYCRLPRGAGACNSIAEFVVNGQL